MSLRDRDYATNKLNLPLGTYAPRHRICLGTYAPPSVHISQYKSNNIVFKGIHANATLLSQVSFLLLNFPQINHFATHASY
jgi:hypothetical protein